MPFSSQEIENKEFVLALRGYHRDEVKAFLRAVAADYRSALEGPRDEAGARLESLSTELAEVVRSAGESTESLRRRLQDEAAAVRRRAEQEAADLHATAEAEAQEIKELARRQAAEIRAAAERLVGRRLEEIALQTEELHSIQEKLRQRFYFLETALQLARQDLGGDGRETRREPVPEIPVSAAQFLDPSSTGGERAES